MARLQSPEIAGPEKLQAPAAVTDLYAPPPKPVINNNLGDLATALSSFNTDLRRFAATNVKATSETEQAAANKWIAGHSNEEWKGAVKTGALPAYQDPVANGVIQKDFGNRVAAGVKGQIDSDITSGKIDLLHPDTNVDTILSGATKTAIDQVNAVYPNSKFAASALAGHVTELRTSLVEKQEKARVESNLAARLGVVQNQFNGFIGEAGKLADPNGLVKPEVGQAAHDNIRGAYKELGASLGLPPAWMDVKLIETLKGNAKTNPEIVWQILNDPRKDEKGNALPSLASNPRYAKDVQELVNTLTPALGKKFDTIQNNDTVQGGIEALNRQDGSYWQIHDKAYTNPFTGEQKIIDADTQRKGIMARYQTWSDQTAANRQERQDMKFDREFPVYEKANIPNPVWKHTLEGVSTALSSPAALSNPQERAKLGAAGELYLNMSAKNYSYIKNTVNLPAHSQNFYDVYEVARKYMGLNQDQATDTAASAVNQRENATDLAVQAAQHKEIEQKVKSGFGSGAFSWLTGSGATNLGQAQKRLTDIASVLVRVNGMSAEDAVTNAEKLLKDRSYIINGHVVTDQGYLPPKEMEQHVGTALTQFFNKHGVENSVGSASELSIRPDGSGNFQITKDVGSWHQPVYARKGDASVPAVITMNDLYRLRNEASSKGHEQIIEQQSHAAENAASLQGTDSKLLTRKEQPANRQQQQRLNALQRKPVANEGTPTPAADPTLESTDSKLLKGEAPTTKLQRQRLNMLQREGERADQRKQFVADQEKHAKTLSDGLKKVWSTLERGAFPY